MKSKRKTSKRRGSKRKSRFPNRKSLKEIADIDFEHDRINKRNVDLRSKEKLKYLSIAALLTGTYLISSKLKHKFKIPYIILKKNGILGYYNNKKEWMKKPQTDLGKTREENAMIHQQYVHWQEIQKKNSKFIHFFL